MHPLPGNPDAILSSLSGGKDKKSKATKDMADALDLDDKKTTKKKAEFELRPGASADFALRPGAGDLSRKPEGI